MKLNQFKSMLRELIREEVQLAVRSEFKKLNENRQPARANQATPRPSFPQQRTTPLVTLDEPFTNVGGALGDLLNETAMNMQAFGEETFEAPNPDFAGLSGASTNVFVKDYSAILKRSEELSTGNFRP
jgi:hypothetical protein